MIAMLLTVIGLMLYVGLRYFLSQLKISDGSIEYKKSNQFSSFIYFCGVAYLLYKVNKQNTISSNGVTYTYLVIYSLISVAASIIALDIMMTVIWGKIETLMLEVLPKYLHKIISKTGYDYSTEIPFVLLLWVISFSFVLFAHRSDSILEILFKPSVKEEVIEIIEVSEEIMDDEEEDRISIQTIDRGSSSSFEYVQIPEQRVVYHKPQVHYRGVNTLPSELNPPPTPRRSSRRRSRQCIN